MKTIFDFLELENQNKIKNLASLSENTYEDSLDKYSKLLVEEFDLLDLNKKIDNIYEENYRKFCEFLKERKEEIKINVQKDVEVLKQIYLKYVNGEMLEALKLLREHLESIDILKNNIFLEEDIFFRARESNIKLSKKEIFHIPFNKRYLISTQRYSLNGRPLLYLGESIECVSKELGKDLTTIDNLYFSAFYLKERIKIFDFTVDSIYTDIKSKLLKSDLEDTFLKEVEIKETLDKMINYFRQIILINVCSFKRRHEGYNNFCEEYVLPQLISEIANQNEGINGIKYKSTKKFSTENLIFKENNKEAEYNNNIALFTKYKNNSYDINLYNSFIILTPIKKGDLIEFSNTEIDNLIKKKGHEPIQYKMKNKEYEEEHYNKIQRGILGHMFFELEDNNGDKS